MTLMKAAVSGKVMYVYTEQKLVKGLYEDLNSFSPELLFLCCVYVG